MEIKPFKALRFDSSVVGDVGNCIAPPYDVIDAEMQKNLYNRSEYNIVRIIKGSTYSEDDEENNQYTRAMEFLDSLIKSSGLKADPTEAIYAYIQDFCIGSQNFRRSSIVALGRLEEFGRGVRPHEKTLDAPKADRLKLMRVKGAQFGQIFMLYDDPERIACTIMGKSASKPALLDFTDDDGVRHKLFAIDEAGDIEAIVKMMADKMGIIADGHHRYESALSYYKETQNPAAAYRMMTFVNMRNGGLVILPTHRLIGGASDFGIDKLIVQIEETFDIIKYPFTGSDDKSPARRKMFDYMKSRFNEGKNAFGIYIGGNVFYVAVLKDNQAMASSEPQMSQVARGLDVNVLHTLILEKVLGIGKKELASQSNIEYIKDIGDAIDKTIDKVDSGKSQVVFFMNPTRIEQVKEVAGSGEKMPQKSTFFYPKIYTGLVINKL
jgi:uncharacterized protein (DUF1015 family)